MKFELLGAKLLMKTSQTIESQPGFELVSVVEKILPDNHLLITAPIHRGTIFPVSLKETLYVHFLTEDSRYDFICLVIDRPIINNLYYLKVRLISEITRSQRRDHFRIKKHMKSRIALEGKLAIDAKRHPGAKNAEGIVEFDCITHDISAGGLSLYTKQPCELRDIVAVSLPVGQNNKMVNFLCEVVWVSTCERPDEYKNIIGMKFIYEDNQSREDMVKYVFMLQYEMIRKKN